MIDVVQATSDATSPSIWATARTTLACNPICQPTIMLGDDAAFSNSAYASSTLLADRSDSRSKASLTPSTIAAKCRAPALTSG